MSGTRFIRNICAVLLISTAAIPGSAIAHDVSIVHARGEITLSATPKKVAVFDMASLDILNALGIDAVVGVPKPAEGRANFPPHIAKYDDAQYAAVGTLFEPDEAALKTLAPDLIIVGGRSRNKFDSVATIAPTIDMSGSGSDVVATTISTTRTLGKVFGVDERAEERIAAFEKTITTLREQGKTAGKGLILFSAGENISAQAPGSRFGTVYDLVGIDSVMPTAEPSTGGPRPKAGSPEALAARKLQQEQLAAALSAEPDWIFTIDRSAAVSNEPSTLPQRLAENEQITSTKAWKEKRVVHLDPKTWYLVGTGIDALSSSAEAISQALAASN